MRRDWIIPGGGSMRTWSGRWTSPDPYTGSMTIADPQSFHRYNYTQNDPVNFIDPSGLLDICFWNIPTNREGFEEDPVLEGCIHIDGDFGLNPGIGGGPGGGGGPGPVPQKKHASRTRIAARIQKAVTYRKSKTI